jgi:large subunit ribosomal protein L24
MNKKLKIKKGDSVIVIAGKDKGKTGNITSVLKEKERVLVQGINIVKRHRKPTQETPGKIDEIEASIHISNVAHVYPETGKATRVKFKIEDGIKKRFSVASESLLEK